MGYIYFRTKFISVVRTFFSSDNDRNFKFGLFVVHSQLYGRSIMYLFQKGKEREYYFVGLMSLYTIGYMGYIFVPAIGPYDYIADKFTGPLKGYFFRDLLNWGYPSNTNLTDVFPSLHCAVSLFILLADYVFHRTYFKISVVPCLLLWISTVYLRYHYGIDCLVGFSVAIICFVIMKIYMKKKGGQSCVRYCFLMRKKQNNFL